MLESELVAASPSTGPRPLRILIVEPDDRCDEVIRQSLGRGAEVFRVERVTSMAEALEQVSRARYDCALIEYELPDGTALDFLQATGVAERVPVIVMTENRRDSIAALQALQWGASDYLFRNELPAPSSAK